jgi:hypothetical protein
VVNWLGLRKGPLVGHGGDGRAGDDVGDRDVPVRMLIDERDGPAHRGGAGVTPVAAGRVGDRGVGENRQHGGGQQPGRPLCRAVAEKAGYRTFTPDWLW